MVMATRQNRRSCLVGFAVDATREVLLEHRLEMEDRIGSVTKLSKSVQAITSMLQDGRFPTGTSFSTGLLSW
jgi:hypothetical protein